MAWTSRLSILLLAGLAACAARSDEPGPAAAPVREPEVAAEDPATPPSTPVAVRPGVPALVRETDGDPPTRVWPLQEATDLLRADLARWPGDRLRFEHRLHRLRHSLRVKEVDRRLVDSLFNLVHQRAQFVRASPHARPESFIDEVDEALARINADVAALRSRATAGSSGRRAITAEQVEDLRLQVEEELARPRSHAAWD